MASGDSYDSTTLGGLTRLDDRMGAPTSVDTIVQWIHGVASRSSADWLLLHAKDGITFNAVAPGSPSISRSGSRSSRTATELRSNRRDLERIGRQSCNHGARGRSCPPAA